MTKQVTHNVATRSRISLGLAAAALFGLLTTGLDAQTKASGASTATSSSSTAGGPAGTVAGSITNDRNLNPGYRPPTGQLPAPQKPAVYDGMGRKSVPEPYIAPAAPQGSRDGSPAPRACGRGAAC